MSEVGILVPQSKANASNPEPAPRILIIDDEAAIRESLETLLVLEGYVVDLASEGQAGLRAIDSRSYDLVLLDSLCRGKMAWRFLAAHPGAPAKPAGDHDYGLWNGRQRGRRHEWRAQNFVQKPWDNEKLLADIRAATARQRAEEENVQLKRALKQRYNFENIVGKSEPMLRIFDLVARLLPPAPPF